MPLLQSINSIFQRLAGKFGAEFFNLVVLQIVEGKPS